MRFLLDHHVDSEVGRMLRSEHHTCWSVAEAGLQQEQDDVITAYASTKDAVVVTHDREFSTRRSRNVVGRHIWLEVDEWDAAALLLRYLEEALLILERHQDVVVHLTRSRMSLSFKWS